MKDNGWEDPNPIDITIHSISRYAVKKKSLRPDTIMTGNRFFDCLINNYIGRRHFSKVSKGTKKILLDEAYRMFTIFLIRKYGSLHNYQKDRVRRRWNMTYCEYKDMLAGSLGYKNKNHQELERLKKKGLARDYNSRALYYLKKRGFKTRNEYADFLARRKGYKDNAEFLREKRKKRGSY